LRIIAQLPRTQRQGRKPGQEKEAQAYDWRNRKEAEVVLAPVLAATIEG